MRDTYYEVHAEHDGHVSGSYSRDTAESMVAEFEEEYNQDHYIVEREEVTADV